MADSAPSEDAIIELERVHKAFGDHVVLDDVSLRIPRGKTTVLIGPSGTGKSVLLKLIVGLLQPDSGSVRVFGVDMARASERERFAVRKRLGMMFQHGALFGSMNVGDNIAFPLVHHTPLTEAQRRARVAEVLEMVELPGYEDRAVSDLSGGQQKRVSLARAIVMEPEIVLFDEPNSGLDPLTSDTIDALIQRMRERLGITFVVITHDIVSTFQIADRVGMLWGGQLIAYAEREAFLQTQDPVVRRFLARNLSLAPLDPTAPC